jgi:hypothetical protein
MRRGVCPHAFRNDKSDSLPLIGRQLPHGPIQLPQPTRRHRLLVFLFVLQILLLPTKSISNGTQRILDAKQRRIPLPQQFSSLMQKLSSCT